MKLVREIINAFDIFVSRCNIRTYVIKRGAGHRREFRVGID